MSNIWVVEDDYKYHLQKGSYNPYHVYEDGRTLPEMQPDEHFAVPPWCWWIYKFCDWLLGCAEMLCRRFRRYHE